MRRMVAVALALSVVAAVGGAPLVHAHVGEHGRSGVLVEVHVHLSGHGHDTAAADGPRLDHGDSERTVYLGGLVSASPPSTAPAAAPADVFTLAVPAERRARRRLQVIHGHDPPSAPPGPARAPPATLS